MLEIDELQLYFGDDYVINDYIKVHQPTIGELIEYGERPYYSMIQTITAIPSEMKSQLFDMGIDWCAITDFQLAMMLWPTLPQEKTKILFGDLDLQKFLHSHDMRVFFPQKDTRFFHCQKQLLHCEHPLFL